MEPLGWVGRKHGTVDDAADPAVKMLEPEDDAGLVMLVGEPFDLLAQLQQSETIESS